MGPGPWVLEILVGRNFLLKELWGETQISLGSNSGSHEIRSDIVTDDKFLQFDCSKTWWIKNDTIYLNQL